jgi:Tfp pilus assembly protein PilN
MINLLPYRERKVIERVRMLRAASSTLGALIVLTIVGGLLFLPTLMTINSRHALAEDQIALLEQEGIVASAVDIANLENRANMLVSKFAAPTGIAPIDRVITLRRLVTNGISLTGFVLDTTDQRLIQINGIAASREALQVFVGTLEEEGSISMVDSPITNYVKSKDNEFTIKVTFKE